MNKSYLIPQGLYGEVENLYEQEESCEQSVKGVTRFYGFLMGRLLLQRSNGDNSIYVNISSVVLQKLLGRSYRSHINRLRDNNLLNVNESYLSGDYPKSYALVEEFRYKQCELIIQKERKRNNLILDDELLEEQKATRNKLHNKLSNISIDVSGALYHIITSLSDEYNLKINTHQLLKNIQGNNITACTAKLMYSHIIQRLRSKGIQRYTRYSQSAEKVYSYVKFLADFKAVLNISSENMQLVGDRYGRVHTPLTNSSSRLKEFVLIDDKPIVGFDITNSQPLFLSLLLIELEPNNECINRFYQLCSSGQLYEQLGKSYREKYNLRAGNIELRNIIKKKLFKEVVFCSITTQRKEQLGNLFNEMFPDVFDKLIEMKQGRYQNVAWKLQKMESSVMIDSIVQRLCDEYEDVNLYTVHDCIYTNSDYEEVVDNAIREYFLENYNMEVPINIDRYGNELLAA